MELRLPSESRWVALGRVLFRWRDYTPLPLLLLFVRFAEPTALLAGVGVACVLIGEFIRLTSLRHIGGASRTRGSSPGASLVRSGPFARVRNPLYLGNFGIAVGVGFLSGHAWAVVVAVGSFLAQYIPIVLWEETRLREQFGDAYDLYRKEVPRWLPRLRRAAPSTVPPASLSETLRTERRTLTAIALMFVLFAVRSRF
jgi:protein-S-isoprenylcysteine O-methyltransferase Ste14